MSQVERIVVDMQWLADGEKDPHPRYVEIGRDDLSGAHLLSDDQLANSLSMMSTIRDDEDTARMIESHRSGGDYISKSMLGEIGKDRIRWLSRRVAVLEGRYPGSTPAKKEVLEQLQLLCKEKALHMDIWYDHVKGGWGSNWTDGVYTMPALIDAIIDQIRATDDEHIIKADEPCYIERPPIDSPEVFQEYMAEARLMQQIPLLVGWLGVNDQTSHKDLAETLAHHKVKVDPIKVGMALGFINKDSFSKRWQVYVSLARDLLKQMVFIPFANDVYRVHPSGKVLVTSSKYYTANREYLVRIRIEPGQRDERIETPALVVDPTQRVIDTFFPTKPDQQKLDLHAEAVEAMAEEIYDDWKEMAGWVPWVTGGNSNMQEKARSEARDLIGA